MNWSTPRARGIARELFEGSGDRWAHVRSVGRAADDLAAQGLDIPEDVISAAWLHDIGYATRLADKGFHPIDGARWLAAQGAPMGIVALVAYHSGARFEAEERHLTDELAVFPQPDEEMLDLLTLLDMTVGPTGSGVTVGTRLEEILLRYPGEHPVHQAVARSHAYLVSSANRAAARLHRSGARAPSPTSSWTARPGSLWQTTRSSRGWVAGSHACVHYAGRMTDADRAILGAELRRIREDLDLTGMAVGESLGWSQSKISRMETGRFGASASEVARLLDHYGVNEELRAELLSRVARTDGLEGAWTVRSGGAGRRQGQVSAVESRLTSLLQYSALVVPGLLQSPNYTRAAARAGSFGDTEDLVARRVARQRILTGASPPKYSVVLDERAVTRWPGPMEVMVQQLGHILETLSSHRVNLRMLGPGGGAKTFALGSFLVYDFVDGPPIAMCEAQTADLYLSAESDVTAYRRLFKALQKEALDVDATRARLEQLRDQLIS